MSVAVLPVSPPPYFDSLLQRLSLHDPIALRAFGRHVHWGYWPSPADADGTAEDYGRAAEALSQLVCDSAEIRDGMRVLDVGCGFGGTIASLNERFRNLDMVGVNIDPRQLERAEEEFRPRNGNQARWVEADACDLPFDDGSFDAVLAVECIFHFPDRGVFLSEAGRLLSPLGRLALTDFVPPADALPLLRAYAAQPDEAMQRTYGNIDVLCTRECYGELAAAARLELDEDRDLTPHIMPTYRFLCNTLIAGIDDPGERADAERATRRLEKSCATRLLTYSQLAFVRSAASER